MKAWFMNGPGEISLREVADPEPGPGEARIRVRAVGICGSDLECYEGTHPLPNYPRLPGHEFAGDVAATGSDWSGPPVGTRVAVDPAVSCGACYACRTGRPNCCVSVSIAGVHRPGALAQYTLCRASQLYPMPAEMSYETGAAVETLSIGAQATDRAQVREGDVVLVLGAGPIGLCCLLMAKRAGGSVLVSERLEDRRTLAREFGATTVLDPTERPLADAVRELTDGYGAHVVMDATGEIEGAESALEVIGSAGRVVILTLSNEPMRVRPWQLVRQELTVLGSRLTRADYGELVRLAASRAAPVERLITHRFLLAEADAAFQVACERPAGLVKAVVLPHE